MYSFSQIDIYNKCPWAWKLKKIDKLSADTIAPIMAVGSAFHEFAEEYVKHLVATNQTTDITVVDEMFNKVYFKYDRKVTPDVYDEALNLARKWVDKSVIDPSRVLGTESRFCINKNKELINWFDKSAYWRGIIDRMEIEDEETLIIRDYKTGWSIDKDAFQNQTYAWLAKILYPQFNFFRLQLEYVRFGYVDEEYIDTSILPTVENKIEGYIALIEQAKKKNKFEARPGSACAWCDFPQQCEYYKKAIETGKIKPVEELAEEVLVLESVLKEKKATLKENIKTVGHLQVNDGTFAFHQSERLSVPNLPKLFQNLKLFERDPFDYITLDTQAIKKLIETSQDEMEKNLIESCLENKMYSTFKFKKGEAPENAPVKTIKKENGNLTIEVIPVPTVKIKGEECEVLAVAHKPRGKKNYAAVKRHNETIIVSIHTDERKQLESQKVYCEENVTDFLEKFYMEQMQQGAAEKILKVTAGFIKDEGGKVPENNFTRVENELNVPEEKTSEDSEREERAEGFYNSVTEAEMENFHIFHKDLVNIIINKISDCYGEDWAKSTDPETKQVSIDWVHVKDTIKNLCGVATYDLITKPHLENLLIELEKQSQPVEKRKTSDEVSQFITFANKNRNFNALLANMIYFYGEEWAKEGAIGVETYNMEKIYETLKSELDKPQFDDEDFVALKEIYKEKNKAKNLKAKDFKEDTFELVAEEPKRIKASDIALELIKVGLVDHKATEGESMTIMERMLGTKFIMATEDQKKALMKKLSALRTATTEQKEAC